MIIDVSAQSSEDGAVESLHLATLLRVLCCFERVLNVQHRTKIKDEFEGERFTIVSDEVRRWAVVEYQISDKMFGRFSSWSAFHRYLFSQFWEMFCDNQYVLVISRGVYKFAKYVYAKGRVGCCRWEKFSSPMFLRSLSRSEAQSGQFCTVL